MSFHAITRSILMGPLIISFLLSPGCKSCQKPHITAVSLDPCNFGKETGIPFYLPKPLLIVSKNFRSIEQAKVGLTDSAPIPGGFDDQAKYADLNARTNFAGLNQGTPATTQSADGSEVDPAKSSPRVYTQDGAPMTPNEAPSDGLAPATFYTYQIVFIPDMSQKYGLKIRGGPGEIRAAMNLVNGWQFTGLGPYYMKDSSTAQDMLAAGISTRLAGQAAADVLNGVTDLAGVAGGQSGLVNSDHPTVQSLAKTIGTLPSGSCRMTMPQFAQIAIYEPTLMPDGRMEWQPIVDLCFDREYLGSEITTVQYAQKMGSTVGTTDSARTRVEAGTESSQVAALDPMIRALIANNYGIDPDSAAIQPAVAGTQSGGTNSAGGVNQIQVDCNGGCGSEKKEFNLFKCERPVRKRAQVQSRVLRTIPTMSRGYVSETDDDLGGSIGSEDTGVQSGEALPSPGAATTINNNFLTEPQLASPLTGSSTTSADETTAEVVQGGQELGD